MYLGTNEKAWAGMNIVIFGKTPILPMKIEQAIATASPANEVRIDSFEDYDQAYDFCKAQKNIGLIFILENSGEVLASDSFKQLGSHYESKGWPCFGVLLHENEKSMMGYLSLQKNKNLIAYLPVSDFLNSQRTFNALNEVWTLFTTAFEQRLIPEKLQETLLSLVEVELPTSNYNFQMRVLTLLCQTLNISWLEALALKWQPVISILKKTNKKALVPNNSLVQIADMASPHEKIKDIFNVINLKTELPGRLVTVAKLLDEARTRGKLEQVLESLIEKARPGAPALLRRIVSVRENIVSIAADYEAHDVGQVG